LYTVAANEEPVTTAERIAVARAAFFITCYLICNQWAYLPVLFMWLRYGLKMNNRWLIDDNSVVNIFQIYELIGFYTKRIAKEEKEMGRRKGQRFCWPI